MRKGFFSRIWNFEITAEQVTRISWLPVIFILAILLYPIGELLLFPPASEFVTPGELNSVMDTANASPSFLQKHFYVVWLLLLLLVIAFRVLIQADSFRKGMKSKDRGILMRNFAVYFPSVGFGIALKVFIFVLIALILYTAGFDWKESWAAVDYAVLSMTNWIQGSIPTILNLHSKIAALLVALTLFGFTNYFIHWLTHTSRFLWHVVHAPHHMPDYLNPVASPVAYFLDIFILVPAVISQAILAKLFYSEPLVLELALITTFSYAFEIFNHTTVYYKLCVRNKFLKFMTNFLGGHGAYHYVHHSSAKEHQKANLGGGLFLLWDRVFGTFADPPKELPAIGLTGNPEIRMNPFRVMLGGIAKILFELKMNKNLKDRFRILFGGIQYVPPVTKEFVKKAA